MQTPQNEKFRSPASEVPTVKKNKEVLQNTTSTPSLQPSEAPTAFAQIFKAFRYVGLTILHFSSKFRLKRIPEPSALTDQKQFVEDYSRAIHSVMILPYVLVLDMVCRLLPEDKKSLRAIDLCCGPGHFTRMLAKNLDCQEVLGVDLSEPMLQKAQENAQQENLTAKLKYLKSDVASLRTIPSNSMDIVSFMDGAHHMDSLKTVEQILREADRVVKADGIIILLDPVRPKTAVTADLYHRIAGQAYIDLGLNYFNKDFRDSIYASWTSNELFQAIPNNTDRKWIQLVPFGFPAFQIILGVPAGREELFISQGLSSSVLANLIPKEGKADWQLLRMSFRLAKQKIFRSNQN